MVQLVTNVRERASIVQLVRLVVVQGPKVFAARYATERVSVNHPNWRLETVAVFAGSDFDFTCPIIVQQVGLKISRQNIRMCPFLLHYDFGLLLQPRERKSSPNLTL